jgi:hypothetical protein
MGAESIQNAIATIVQDWLNAHPVLGWCVVHPLWAIALLLLSVFLAWGLLGAIAQLAKTLWIALLRAPLRLGKWTGVRLLNLFRQPTDANSSISDLSNPDPFSSAAIHSPPLRLSESELAERKNKRIARLNEVVARLEQLQKEQAQLLQEVRAILDQTSSNQTSSNQTSGTTLQPRLPADKVPQPIEKLL